MKDPDNIIHILAIYGIPCIYALIQHKIKGSLQLHGTVKSRDPGSVSHNIFCRCVTKLENIGYHFCFICFQHPLLMAFIDHGHNIFFRYILITV